MATVKSFKADDSSVSPSSEQKTGPMLKTSALYPVTCLLDIVPILWGESQRWSLIGVKGLKKTCPGAALLRTNRWNLGMEK